MVLTNVFCLTSQLVDPRGSAFIGYHKGWSIGAWDEGSVEEMWQECAITYRYLTRFFS